MKTNNINKENLVGAWSLNQDDVDGSSIKDKSGNGNNGTSANTPVYAKDQAGVPNQAMTFNGTTDLVDLGADKPTDLTGDITISAWIKPINAQGSKRIISNGSVAEGLHLSLSSSNYRLFFKSDGTTIIYSADNSIIYDTWNYVTVTRNSAGDKTNFYINGILSGDADQDSGTPAAGDTNTFIGCLLGDNYFNGNISDVAIYSSALTEDQVRQLYKAGRTTARIKVDARNLVTGNNADFETGVGNWTGITSITGASVGITAKKGSYVGKVTDGSWGYTAMTSFSGEAENSIKKYKIIISAYVPTASGVLKIRVSDQDGEHYLYTTKNDEWEILSYDLNGIVSEGTGFVMMGDAAGQTGDCYVDDLQLVDITNAITPKLQKGLILDMPLASPYTEANNTITKDRTPQGNDGTVSGATIKYDGLVNAGAGIAYINQDKAYGTWEFDFNKVGDGHVIRIQFISDDIDYATGEGYMLAISSNEGIYLYSADGIGGFPTLFGTAVSYTTINTDYRIKITRSLAGVFTVYIKGGTFGWDDWTTVVADSGSNPVTDNTYTTSSYLVADLDDGDKVSNLKIDGKRHSLNKATVSSGTFTTTGPAYDFDGTDDYIDIGADKPSDLTGDITISAWINPSGWDGTSTRRIIDNGKMFFYIRETTPNSLGFTSGSVDYAHSNNNSISFDIWQHVLITRPADGDNVKFYIDGIDETSEIDDSGTPDGTSLTNTFIGNNDATTRTFDGQISGMKIWNRVLSTDDIGYLYSKEKVNY